MAQTQLNRVYVQAIDATGSNVNSLSLGTKALTKSVQVGGVGTDGNSISIGGNTPGNGPTGITIAGSTTLTDATIGQFAVTGQTTLTNTSMSNLGVAGNTSLVNASIQTLSVNGTTTLADTSILTLGVSGNTSMGNVSVQTMRVYGQTTLVNVSITGLTATGNVSIGGNVSVHGSLFVANSMTLSSLTTTTGATLANPTLNGTATLSNASVNGDMNVGGNTTVKALTVNGGTNFNNSVNITSNPLTVTGSTALQNVSVAGQLHVAGNASMGNISTSAVTVAGPLSAGATTLGTTGITGTTNINITGISTTTIGSGSAQTNVGGTLGVGGLLTVTGATTLAGTTITGTSNINTTGSATTILGSATSNTSVNGPLVVGGTLGVAGATTLAGTTIAGATSVNTTGNATTTIGQIAGGTTALNSQATTVAGTLSVAGNVSLSNVSVQGTLSVTGNVSLGNVSIQGNTTHAGYMIVSGQTTLVNASVTGNFAAASITTPGSLVAGPLFAGNASLQNVSCTGLNVSGDSTVTRLLTTGYTTNLFNYAPTFVYVSNTGGTVNGALTVIGSDPNKEYVLTLGAYTAATMTSISPVALAAQQKYTVTLTAYGEVEGCSITLLGSTFSLTTTSATYTRVLNVPATTTLTLAIAGTATKKVTWSSLTLEPYYDMTIGSNLLSVGGNLNVSLGNPVTDWDAARMQFIPGRTIGTTTDVALGTNAHIAYGNNLFVVVYEGTLNAGRYITSTDGVNWSAESTFTGGATFPRGLASNGSNLFVMITGHTNVAKTWTSPNGTTWTMSTVPLTMTSVVDLTYGNGVFLACNNTTTTNNILYGTDGINYTVGTIAMNVQGVGYGTMVSAVNDTYVFVACGTNTLYRYGTNTVSAFGTFTAITSQPIGNWAYVGFGDTSTGNDIFMVTSNDSSGKLTIGTQGGKTWSTPISFNEVIYKPFYVEGTWFIGSATGVYVSKDKGATWTKRTGEIPFDGVVGGGKSVVVGSTVSVLTKKNQRSDGSSISPDTLTLGKEGTTTVIGSDTFNVGLLKANTMNVANIGVGSTNRLSIANNVNVSVGAATTSIAYVSKATNTTIVPETGMFAANTFISATDSNIILTSTDGVTWASNSISGAGTTLFRGLVYGNGIFMLVSYSNNSATNSRVWTSINGTSWTAKTSTVPNCYSIAYGDGVFISAGNTNSNNLSVTIDGTIWTNTQTKGNAFGGIGFGAMSTGENVFIATGNNGEYYRSINKGVDWVLVNTSLGGRYVSFGNDVFIVVTSQSIIISRDGGITWSSSLNFGSGLSNPIYVQNTWYIGTATNGLFISRDNGYTWSTIKTTFSTNILAYGNNKLVSFFTNTQSLCTIITKRTDGTNLTADTLTIGQEGTTTTLGSSILKISGTIQVPPATATSEGGLLFNSQEEYVGSDGTYTSSVSANSLRIQTFSQSIVEPPSSYSGTNVISGFTTGQNSTSLTANSPSTGEYTYVGGTAHTLANIYTNVTVTAGQMYKVMFTVRSTTPGVSIQLRNTGNGVYHEFGYIGSVYKTYIAYVIPDNISLGMWIGVLMPTAVSRTIIFKHFSMEALSSPNVLDITGNACISKRVGIGTTIPRYPLQIEVTDYTSGNITGARWWNNGDFSRITTTYANPDTFSGPTPLSIYASNAILTGGSYISNSDRRIKSNIVDVDDDRALRDLRLLKPKTYTYKDILRKGSSPVYGFIAQEVKEVLEYASGLMTETVPNIYELATFSGDTVTLTFNTSELSRDASGGLFSKLSVKTREGKEEFVNIVEVIDEHTLRVDKDLTDWGGQLDTSGQLVPGNQIFVYGQEVNDFHNLNKDAIWTVATAALQEVDRQLQAEKVKTAELQSTLASVLARLDALENK